MDVAQGGGECNADFHEATSLIAYLVAHDVFDHSNGEQCALHAACAATARDRIGLALHRHVCIAGDVAMEDASSGRNRDQWHSHTHSAGP
mgnify:CR=1 FL=1